MTNLEYKNALEWLYIQMPNYQIEGKKAYKPGLDNIKKLCDFFGNPQNKLTTIHIGGTNGKGSTSNMLASVLQENGYKVGLYTSPHLIDFSERIKINGENASPIFIYNFIQKLKKLPENIRPSFFEFTTIMAFVYFWEQKVDYAIIEVGLGGRLDSTNIIKPLVTAITNVDLDHTDLLGDTLEKIAAEKAGIIKSNTPIVSGETRPKIQNIIKNYANNLNAPFIDASSVTVNYQTDLLGHYQSKNIKIVISIVSELQKKGVKIEENSLKTGLLSVQKNTGFMGRWQVFSKSPLVILDTAHNQAGIELAIHQLNSMPQGKHVILGFVKNKKIDKIIPILPKTECYYFVQPSIERGRNPLDYQDLLEKSQINYKIFQNLQDAYSSVLQNIKSEEMIFIGGSNFVVGEFLEKNLQV